MFKPSRLFLTACLLASTPAFAGNIEFNNGEASWHSLKCTKPLPPPSILEAHPETRGNAMNTLMARRNAYALSVQSYMNCISQEAETDQTILSQTIADSARQEIDNVRKDLDKLKIPMSVPLSTDKE